MLGQLRDQTVSLILCDPANAPFGFRQHSYTRGFVQPFPLVRGPSQYRPDHFHRAVDGAVCNTASLSRIHDPVQQLAVDATEFDAVQVLVQPTQLHLVVDLRSLV